MGSQAGETFFLERVTLEESDDEDFEYDAVDVDDDLDEELDEDKYDDFETLAKAARAKEVAQADGTGDLSDKKLQPVMTKRPEVVDDFIRNFLNKMNLSRTLDTFQTEWYELQQKGLLKETDISIVPDVYLRNQQLDDSVKVLHAELQNAREVAEQARGASSECKLEGLPCCERGPTQASSSGSAGTWDKFRKERDYHRMHHKRVVQEKNKLVQVYPHIAPTPATLRHHLPHRATDSFDLPLPDLEYRISSGCGRIRRCTSRRCRDCSESTRSAAPPTFVCFAHAPI